MIGVPAAVAAPRRVVAIMAILIALGLVACDSQSTAPVSSGSPATPASAGPVAGASAKPSPSRDPGQVALAKFVGLATDDGFAYQASFTGASHHSVDILPISNGLLQVSGADVRVRATFKYKTGSKATVEHRSVGGRDWIRYGSEAWRGMGAFSAVNSMAAFAAVHGPPDVTYLGPKKVGGKAVYEVSLASAIVHPIMIPAGNLTETVVSGSKLILLIDADGRPVSGTETITGRGRVSGQLQEIVIELKLTFAKAGQKVTIAAP